MFEEDDKERREGGGEMNKTRVALGGTGSGHGRRRGISLEDEFKDVLCSVGWAGVGAIGDGYE